MRASHYLVDGSSNGDQLCLFLSGRSAKTHASRMQCSVSGRSPVGQQRSVAQCLSYGDILCKSSGIRLPGPGWAKPWNRRSVNTPGFQQWEGVGHRHQQRHPSIVPSSQQRPTDLRQLNQEGGGDDGTQPSTSGQQDPQQPQQNGPTTPPGNWQGGVQFNGGAGALKLPAGYASSITSMPPVEGKAKGLPHRWRVVLMMAVSARSRIAL